MSCDVVFQGSASTKTGALARGDKVEARCKGKDKWFAGEITAVNIDGTYDIRYEDGDREYNVKSEMVRVKGGAVSGKGEDVIGESKADVGASSRPAPIAKGDKIEARYKGKDKWFGGEVTAVNGDGTFDVRYDDGDREYNVKADMIRLKGGSSSKAAPALARGDKVEARYKGKDKWFAGEITTVNIDGTFDIRYDDGDREYNLKADMVRAKVSSAVGGAAAVAGPSESKAQSGATKVVPLARGDKVEARYKGKDKWFAGEITAVNIDGTYDVRYDDGDREYNVKADMVRVKGTAEVAASDAKAVAYTRGDKVEARYKGKDKWFGGEITAVNSDGTFDIRYEDGDREYNVKVDMIRRTDRSSAGGAAGGSGGAESKADSASGSKGGGSVPTFARDAKVEARYKGNDVWVAGEIAMFNVEDGSYDIRYDNGGREYNVAVGLIRARTSAVAEPSGAAASSRSDTLSGPARALEIGDMVKARKVRCERARGRARGRTRGGLAAGHGARLGARAHHKVGAFRHLRH